jgi:tetratricopeptide (TPR) repeat protein
MAMSIAYQRGIVLYHQKRYTLAADEFRNDLAANPQNVRAMAMLGLSLTYDGKVTEGIEQTKHAVAAEPECGFVYYAMACALVGPPRNVPTGGTLLSMGRWRAYRRRVRDARVPAMEAVRLEPRNPDFLALLGAIALDLRRPKEALHWAELGLAARADHVRSANIRARALGKLGRKKEARFMVETALALDPESASSHATGGWTSLQAGDPRRAVEHFRESVRLNPTDPQALDGLAAARVKAVFQHPLAFIITIAAVVGMGILGGLRSDSPPGVRNPSSGSLDIAMCLVFFLAFFIPIAVAIFIRRRR